MPSAKLKPRRRMRSRSLSAPVRGLARRMCEATSRFSTSTVSCSLVAADRRAGLLRAADELLLLADRGAVPLLDLILILRATRYVPPAIQPAAPLGAAQTLSSIALGVRRVEVGGAVLEAHQVARRVLCPRRSARRSRPATHRSDATPCPVRARLRIAWNATCGSSAHAWTQRSPPDSAGSSWSRWN